MPTPIENAIQVELQKIHDLLNPDHAQVHINYDMIDRRIAYTNTLLAVSDRYSAMGVHFNLNEHEKTILREDFLEGPFNGDVPSRETERAIGNEPVSEYS